MTELERILTETADSLAQDIAEAQGALTGSTMELERAQARNDALAASVVSLTQRLADVNAQIAAERQRNTP
jgi:septal ring factor EnvC (AmiA/AmiB activator)